MSAKTEELLAAYRRKILKSLDHLEYIFQKAQKLSPGPGLSEEELETWESFSARLSRSVALFLTKFLRLRLKQEDPGFDGSLRDFCNLAEKIRIIDDADAWMALRELRNANVHDYEEDELANIHRALLQAAPRVLAIRNQI